MATTGADIIKDALFYAGITGQGIDPSGEDTASAKRICNDMLSEWSARRWLIYSLLDNSIVCDGRVSYTVGPGGAIPLAARPDRVEFAYIRLLQPQSPTLRTDYPLEQLLAREDYSRISLKQMASFPYYFFYDPSLPTGNIYPWPIPNNQYELHILTRVVLPRLDVLGDELIFPEGYEGALKWNLARRIRAAYRYPPNAEINALAANGINVISSNNFAVPMLQVPRELTGGGRYNFYSDQVQ